jgi:hypothetical protein
LQQWRKHSREAIKRSAANAASELKAEQYCTAQVLLAWHALTVLRIEARMAQSALTLMKSVFNKWRSVAEAQSAARSTTVTAAVAKLQSRALARCFVQWYRYTGLQRSAQQAAAVACTSMQRRSLTIAFKHWMCTAKSAVVHDAALIAGMHRRSQARVLHTAVRDWRRVTVVCDAVKRTARAFAAWQSAAVAQYTARQLCKANASILYRNRLQQQCFLAWNTWLAQRRALQHAAALMTTSVQQQRTATALQQWRAAASAAVEHDTVLIARIQQRIGLRILRTVLQQWRQLTHVLMSHARVAAAFSAWQASVAAQQCTRSALCDAAVTAHNCKQLQQCFTACCSWQQQRKTVRRAAAAVTSCINKHCCGSMLKQWRALTAQQTARYAALISAMQRRTALRTMRTVVHNWRQLTRTLVTQACLAAAFSVWQSSATKQIAQRSTAYDTAVKAHSAKLQQQCFTEWQQWLAVRSQAAAAASLQHEVLVCRMQKRSAERSIHAVFSAWWRVTQADVAYRQHLKRRCVLQWRRYRAARRAHAERLGLANVHLKLCKLSCGLTAFKRWRLRRAQHEVQYASVSAELLQHAVHRRAVAVTAAVRFWRSEAVVQQRLAEYVTQQQLQQLQYALQCMKARCAHGGVKQLSALQTHFNKVKLSAVRTWRHVVTRRSHGRSVAIQQYKQTLLTAALQQWCASVSSAKHQHQQLLAAAQAHVLYSERTATSDRCQRAIRQWRQHAQACALARSQNVTAAAHHRRAVLTQTLRKWLHYVQAQCTLQRADAHYSTAAAHAALRRWHKLQQQACHLRFGSTAAADLLRLYTGLRRWAVYSTKKGQFRTRCAERAQSRLHAQQQRALVLWRARTATAVESRKRCDRAVGSAQQLRLQRGVRKWCTQCKLIVQKQRDSGLGSLKEQSDRKAAALLTLQQWGLR